MSYTVLIVDDQLSSRVMIREYLSGLGADVIFGTNGREALELSADFEPDLLVIDYHMPFLGGIEASRIIHMSQPDLPILMVTGSISDELREHAIHAGVSRILCKPVDAEELRFFASKALGTTYERV